MNRGRKKRIVEKTCFLCKGNLKIKKVTGDILYPQKVCLKCKEEYDKHMENAKTVRPPKDSPRECLLCGTGIGKGDLCEPCFIKMAKFCTDGFKPERVSLWELIERKEKKNDEIIYHYDTKIKRTRIKLVKR